MFPFVVSWKIPEFQTNKPTVNNWLKKTGAIGQSKDGSAKNKSKILNVMHAIMRSKAYKLRQKQPIRLQLHCNPIVQSCIFAAKPVEFVPSP